MKDVDNCKILVRVSCIEKSELKVENSETLMDWSTYGEKNDDLLEEEEE